MLCLLALALAAPAPVAPVDGVEPPVTERAQLEVPVALVVRGGASLGSYQAGYLHYTSVALAARREAQGVDGATFDVVTGASAGALNTLVTAVSSCLKAPTGPEDSLYWLWTQVRVDPAGRDEDAWNLFRRDEIGATHAFTREPFLQAAWAVGDALADPERWIDGPCQVDMGFVVSRVASRDVRLSRGRGTGLRAARQTEKVVVRVDKPAGEAPRLFAVTPRAPDGSKSPNAHFYLHLGLQPEGEPLVYDDLVAVLAASSGFPFAFAPLEVPHQEYRLDGELRRNDRTAETRFVDGGLFENLPLRLATTIGAWRAHEAQRPTSPRTFVVLDTDVESWRRQPLEASTAPGTDAIAFGLDVLSSYIAAAEDAELLAAIEADADLALSPIEAFDSSSARDQLFVPARRAIPASVWFWAFLGLFEEDFRIFDFYLGMLEARHNARLAFPEEIAAFESSSPPSVDSDLFECFKAWDRATDGFAHTVTREQEPAACAVFDSDQARGNMVPLLRAATALRGWTESPEYDTRERVAFDTWVEMLHASEFRWQTFKHSADGLGIRRQVRDFLEIAVRGMARRNGPKGVVLDAVARVVVDGYAYQPPRITPFVGLHSSLGLEGGVGVRATRWLRPTLALRFTGFGDRFITSRGTPVWGMRVEPVLRLDITPTVSPLFRVEPWLGYAPQFPFTFEGRAVGERHVVAGGVHLVGLNLLYVTLGGGWAVHERVAEGFQSSSLRPFTGRGHLEISFGIRFPQ